MVIHYQCSLEVSERRLIQRGQTSRRSDDLSIEIIRRRYHEFETHCASIVRSFQLQGKVVEIPCSGNVNEVYELTRRNFIRPRPLKLKKMVFVLGGPGTGELFSLFGTRPVKLII